MFRAIAKPIVPPAPSTATVSAVRAGRLVLARAGRAAGVPRCAMCDPLCFLGADTRARSRLHREEGGTVPSGGVLGQADQVGGADVVSWSVVRPAYPPAAGRMRPRAPGSA